MKIQARRKSNGDGFLRALALPSFSFLISSINVPWREILLNILVAYKWLNLYINSPLKKEKTEKELTIRGSKEEA